MMPSFADYYCEVTSHVPFAWQSRFAREVEAGSWPTFVSLPTAAGKTGLVEIWAYCLALELDRGASVRHVPLRLVWVVDRRIVVDGQPVVTGLLPVGDAWACTNPNAGRGVSLGLAHAITLRDTLREHSDDPARLGMEYDRVTEETLTPWYRDQVDQDNQIAAKVQATIDGRPPASSADDPATQMQAALFTAASADADVARADADVLSCLALPAEVLARPGIREKVAAYVGVEPPQLPGPSRAELLALVS